MLLQVLSNIGVLDLDRYTSTGEYIWGSDA